eukprot:595389-Rhodomonas_salina.1
MRVSSSTCDVVASVWTAKEGMLADCALLQSTCRAIRSLQDHPRLPALTEVPPLLLALPSLLPPSLAPSFPCSLPSCSLPP